VGRLGEPPRGALAEAHPGQLPRDDLTREEVVADEVAETAADAVLPLGDDRRVRDGDAHRVPEERGDGEPVGDPADHRGLGRGAEQGDPEGRQARSEVRDQGRGEEEDGECGEQRRRTAPHDRVLESFFGIVADDQHRTKISTGRRIGRSAGGHGHGEYLVQGTWYSPVGLLRRGSGRASAS
jgi:hypothetical protein